MPEFVPPTIALQCLNECVVAVRHLQKMRIKEMYQMGLFALEIPDVSERMLAKTSGVSYITLRKAKMVARHFPTEDLLLEYVEEHRVETWDAIANFVSKSGLRKKDVSPSVKKLAEKVNALLSAQEELDDKTRKSLAFIRDTIEKHIPRETDAII
jgi:hypothetical protein